MGLGAALTADRSQTSPIRWCGKLRINISGCPNSCGQHWIGDIGFYGNARKIDGREVPYYLMLLGGTQHEFGVAIQSLPARLAPVGRGAGARAFQGATGRKARLSAPTCCATKWSSSSKLTADLVKPAELASGDVSRTGATTKRYSLKLGRGECAA